MATKTIKRGQSWWDVGIELKGDWTAGIDLALSLGASMTDAPPMLEVQVPSKTYDKVLEHYCRVEGVSPATLESSTPRHYQIFSPVFNQVFS